MEIQRRGVVLRDGVAPGGAHYRKQADIKEAR